MAEIRLLRGEVALVDDNQVERLSKYRWYANGGYATAYIEGRVTKMHRMVMNAADGEVVDHRNGDPLDNRSANLRICTQSENCLNRAIHKNNRLGVKGVYLDTSKKTPRYRAQISVDGKCIRLGSFKTLEAAQQAYASAAPKYHGEFARTS